MTYLILALVLIIVVLWVIVQKGIQLRRNKKWPKQKEAILNLFSLKQEVSNDDVQHSLKVSDSTATRLLQKLADDGTIEQAGSTRGTTYKLRR